LLRAVSSESMQVPITSLIELEEDACASESPHDLVLYLKCSAEVDARALRPAVTTRDDDVPEGGSCASFSSDCLRGDLWRTCIT
jgi:hypothetical protein